MIFEVQGSLFRIKNGSKIGSESHLRRGSPQKASWRPLGALLEALGAEKISLERLLGGQERPKSDSNFVFVGSQSFQEHSKRLPRGFLRASASKMRFGSDFRPIFDSKKRALDLKNH